MEFITNWQLYLMAVPGFIWFLAFSYIPLCWLQIAFKDYNIMDGAFGSPFLKGDIFENFKIYFKSQYFFRTTFNTLFLNTLSIFFTLLASVTLAILLNEVRIKFVKKIYQSVIFMPTFLSTIVVAAFLYSLLGEQFGVVNSVLNSMGLKDIHWYSVAWYWPIILTIVAVWMGAGSGSVIYLASISSISPELYEAAKMDGANKRQEIFNITVPQLMPTMVILTILNIGNIFRGNFQLIYSIVGNNGLLLPTTDVIDTYVFRGLTFGGTYGESTAVGLYQSVMGFLVVILANKLSKKIDDSYGLF